MSDLDLTEVRDFLRQFAADRDWEQFHTPKNLAMALAGEAAEVLEIFQWLTPEESKGLPDEQRQHLGEELADVLQYVVRLADVGGIDLRTALWAKLRDNEQRYEAESVRGSSERRSRKDGEGNVGLPGV